MGHPEKLIDFAYRAVHEMTVTSKAMIQNFYGTRRAIPIGTAAPPAAARV